MPTKLRLQRRGKKGQAFYHIIIADGRAPRDGKFIEKIGTYNPLTKPADIEIDFDRALYWLQSGAQPTETVRTILSYKGVLYKNHLAKGIKKGALTQEQADAKFDGWLKEKQEKIVNKIKETTQEGKNEEKKRFDAEKKVNEERAQEIAAKRASELKAEAAAKAKAEVTEVIEEKTTDVVEKETIEATEPETKEVAMEEVPTEMVAESTSEEPVSEVNETNEEVKAEEPKEDDDVKAE